MLSMSTDTELDVKEKLENDSVREILILTAFSVYAISYLKMVYLEKSYLNNSSAITSLKDD